jgi:multidrug resistance efflux pump
VGNEIKKGGVLGRIDRAEIRKQLQQEQEQIEEFLAQDQIKTELQNQHTQLSVDQNTAPVTLTPPSPGSPQLTETNRLSLDSAAIPK